MGVGKQKQGIKYVSIKKGKVAIWDRERKEDDLYDYVEGTIIGVKFEMKTIENKPKEFCNLNIVDGEDTFIVQLPINSGYFRAFVNGLKSGNHKNKVRLVPTYSEEGTMKNSSMFVSPAGDMQKAYPWYATKKDMKDVPLAKSIPVNGEMVTDRTEQNEYWKKWLTELQWTPEIEAASITPMPTKASDEKSENNSVTFDDDDSADLPF